MSPPLQPVTPYLYYRDVAAALDWLAKAFGWREKMRAAGPDGRPFHAEMAVGSDGVILMGCPGPHYQNPKQLGHVTQSLYVRIDDVDALFARAIEVGAAAIEQPADQEYGDRRCALEDCEGHYWYFAQPIAKTA
jgi:PhnB protein